MALLVKQAWSLLTNLDSLVSRTLKAKYYPHSDLLTAPNTLKPCYLYMRKSIYVGTHLLAKDVRW